LQYKQLDYGIIEDAPSFLNSVVDNCFFLQQSHEGYRPNKAGTFCGFFLGISLHELEAQATPSGHDGDARPNSPLSGPAENHRTGHG
jgi:hypothetical protein